MNKELRRARLMLFGAALLVNLGMILALPFTTISIDLNSFWLFYALAAVLSAMSQYCRWRMMNRMALILEVQYVTIVLSTALIICTYIFVSSGYPLADEWLLDVDRTLGFDWLAFVKAVDSNALLARLLFSAYVSFGYQLMILPLLLIMFDEPERAYGMIICFALACSISGFVSIWTPALSAYSVLAVDPTQLRNINPHFGYAFLEQFNAVRSGMPFVVRANEVEGILTFPSCHVAVACICAWAAWTNRVLRYPVAILNFAMAISAISHGSHYLADVIAGTGVAGISIALACFGIFGRHGAKMAGRQPLGQAR